MPARAEKRDVSAHALLHLCHRHSLRHHQLGMVVKGNVLLLLLQQLGMVEGHVLLLLLQQRLLLLLLAPPQQPTFPQRAARVQRQRLPAARARGVLPRKEQVGTLPLPC